jgi:uncharacterized membrane protein YoaK (UPF0700 family)
VFKHQLYRDVDLKVATHWFLLCFLAGNVNAGGFIACQRFVTHVTGFGTLFGIEAAHGNFDRAFGIVSVPLFFLLGVMISAYLVDLPVRKGKRPHYATVMCLEAACLAVAGIAGHLGYFGAFGEEIKLRHDYFLLALLCAASGLQNATVSTSSGATVRTTHLTGVTTDLGIGLVRWLVAGKHNLEIRLEEKKAALLRTGSIVAYVIGGAAGAITYFQFGYLAFLLPAILALYTMYIALKTKA